MKEETPKDTINRATAHVMDKEAEYMTKLIKGANHAKTWIEQVFFKTCLEEEVQRIYPKEE